MPGTERPGWDYRAGDDVQLERIIAELGDYVLPAHSQAVSQLNNILEVVSEAASQAISQTESELTALISQAESELDLVSEAIVALDSQLLLVESEVASNDSEILLLESEIAAAESELDLVSEATSQVISETATKIPLPSSPNTGDLLEWNGSSWVSYAQSNIDHNALTNYVANEHIDWTNATQDLLTTGNGTFSGSLLSEDGISAISTEKLVDPGFDTPSEWTGWTISGSTASYSGAPVNLTQTNPFTVETGVSYIITVNIVAMTNTITLRIGGAVQTLPLNVTGTYTYVINTTSTSAFYISTTGGGCTLSSISVKKISDVVCKNIIPYGDMTIGNIFVNRQLIVGYDTTRGDTFKVYGRIYNPATGNPLPGSIELWRGSGVIEAGDTHKLGGVIAATKITNDAGGTENAKIGFFPAVPTSQPQTPLAWIEPTTGYIKAEKMRLGDATVPTEDFEVAGTSLFLDKVGFSQADMNEYIVSSDDGYMDYGATTAHRFNSDVEVTGDISAVGGDLLLANGHEIKINTYRALSLLDAGNNTLAIGKNAAFNLTTGTKNAALGSAALGACTEGIENIGVGFEAGRGSTTGSYNVSVGSSSLYKNTGGSNNVCVGRLSGGYAGAGGSFDNCVLIGGASGSRLTTGSANICLGLNCGAYLTTGANNVLAGHYSGHGLTGSSNIFIGYASGIRQTAISNMFLVDCISRADAATELTNAILYGIMAATPANQTLTINAITKISQIKSGATQAGAGAVANEIWKTASHASLPDNVLMIGV